MVDQLLKPVVDSLASNQFLSGGAILMVLGASLAYARKVPSVLYQWFRQRAILSITLSDDDPSVAWMREWFAQQDYGAKTKRLMVATSVSAQDETGLSIQNSPPTLNTSTKQKKNYEPRVVMTPAPGFHVFWYRGHLAWVEYQRQKLGKGEIVFGYTDNYYVSILGGTRKLAQGFIQDVQEAAKRKEPGFRIFRNQWSEWHLLKRELGRSPDSLNYADDLFTKMVKDIEMFRADEEWYANMGIPWRRGYLLDGEPGNGKTSLVLALATYFGADIYIINLSGGNVGDNSLQQLLVRVPVGAFVLIEEVDTIYNKRDSSVDHDMTFSGFINALDGIGAVEGRILFMTTNHKEKLDGALIRPGRADVHHYIGNATWEQMVAIYQRFYPEYALFGTEFANSLPDGEISMAQLQEYLLERRGDAKRALNDYAVLIPNPVDSVVVDPEQVISV